MSGPVPDLLPCPFCGGEAHCQAHRVAEDAMVAFVSCQKCGVSTEQFEDAYAPNEQAITAWNTRSPDLLAMVENLAGDIGTLFNAIAHGDAEHREWLAKAIDQHFCATLTEYHAMKGDGDVG